jgi:CheY-like chemotaxis protein
MVDPYLALPTEQRQPLKLILLVEDDEANAEVLIEVLTEELSCTVRHVSTGIDALQAIEDLTPHLIVLDYLLPGMNGLELYDRLHMLPGLSSIPVFFLSASSHRDEIERRHLPFLEKPYELETFLSTLCRLLES